MRLRLITGLLALSVASCTLAWGAPKGLYYQYLGKTVKVFVQCQKSFDDKAGEISETLFADKLKEALRSRKSTRFEIVDNVDSAQMIIETRILGFYWSDHDPLDMIVGVGAAAMDAAKIEDYASLDGDFLVRDQKGRSLWKDKIRGTVTKKPMPRPESAPLVMDDLVKTFMMECFSKKRSRA